MEGQQVQAMIQFEVEFEFSATGFGRTSGVFVKDELVHRAHESLCGLLKNPRLFRAGSVNHSYAGPDEIRL